MNYRQKILEEAAIMFRTYGIRAVTMDMLANQLGISKRTIYEVFRDKDDLLDGVLKWMTEKQLNITAKALAESENVIEAIFKLLRIMNDHFQKISPAFYLDIRKLSKNVLNHSEELKDLPYYRNNSEMLLRGIKEGVFRDDIDVNITNKCMLEVVRLSNDENLFPHDSHNMKDVIRNFYINYLRGISTQKGLELIDRYEKEYEF
ncbi:MAG: TetR/AcrR family transcriptional regulator [Bacteroidales bacterium]|jgi:AcrR family transcriptional regulator|nr:TetR/AcrR family transcriptional regulator [Bacteroidales bacterium]